MERYPASIGSGIFRCRSGCAPVVGGGPILNGFPSARWSRDTDSNAIAEKANGDRPARSPLMPVARDRSKREGLGLAGGRRLRSTSQFFILRSCNNRSARSTRLRSAFTPFRRTSSDRQSLTCSCDASQSIVAASSSTVEDAAELDPMFPSQ